MSKKKEEIDLNISTEVSDDEFEDEFDETLTEDNENDENDIEENNEGELDEDSINENFENDEDELNIKKSSLEDSVNKSELDKNTLTDNFLDEDEEEDDDTEILDPNYEMNEVLQVPNEERISRNILTKYEIVRIIGTRAKQISDGSKVFVKYDGNKSAIELAELELKHKMVPLKIKRPLPNGKFEIWKISELELLENI